MKGHRTVKPVVQFLEFGRFVEYTDDIRMAILIGVLDHPRLGREAVVNTSRIVSVDNEEAPTLIETRNTIYKKVEHNER